MAQGALIVPHLHEESVLMITGAYPPDICGVGDYTDRLMAVAPPSWGLLVERNWSWLAAPGIIQRLLSRNPATVVIQYPTQGYGWSLVPHLLVFIGWLTRRYCSVLALHEFTSLSRKSQLALAFASHFAARIIFTTEVERDRARASRFFSSRVPTSVIGILSNIPSSDRPPLFLSRSIDIAYFGHIRPNKGLETFLDVIARIRASDPEVRIALIGEVPKGYEPFGNMVAGRCDTLGVTMMLGLDDETVGRTLGNVRILYLPFPDGVSARRGSALAGFSNGAIVATRIGDATPTALRPAVIACSGTPEDAAILRAALHMAPDESAALQQNGRNYIAMMLPRDWAHVAILYDEAVAHSNNHDGHTCLQNPLVGRRIRP
jgi:glycosyltransferase involved in cell wall biosynthesis